MILSFILNGCGSSPSPTATPTALIPTKASPTPTPTQIPVGETITVISTMDSGSGTLRQALLDAQSGDTITFDPNVFPPTAPVAIPIASELPHIHQGHVTVDASNAGVILDGNNISMGGDVTGLSISSNGNIVRGLQIINFPGVGIQFHSGSDHNMIEGNLISRNGNVGIGMFNVSNNTIMGNYIGTDPSGSQAWGNHHEGIYIEEGSNIKISQNIICDNGASGITLQGSNTSSNAVSENLIGFDASQSFFLGTYNNGVEIRHGAHSNMVSSNIIANTNSYSSSIQIYGSDSLGNTISQNSIYDSRWIGIDLWGGGNLELAPPIIIDFDLNASSIRGLAYPNASVEVFSIDNNNRSVFEGGTDADSDGIFFFEKGEPFTGPRLTVSATDVSGNTSEFSLITDGMNGTTSLQPGNPTTPTRLETYMSDELEDNHIPSFWHSLWDYYPLSEILDQVRYLGAKRFRFTINGGEADKIDWSKKDEFSIDPSHDEFVNNLVANNIQLTYMLSFWDIATWPDGIDTPCPRFKTEEEIQHYLEYVSFVIDHFGDRIQYYEIWNEPDNTACPQWIEVEDYIKLVRRTVPVIRKEYPDAKIQVGGTTGLSNPDSQEYLFNILQSDIMPLVDVISWHPFYGDSPEHNSDYYYAYPSIVQRIKDTASAHGFEGEYEADEMDWRPFSEPDGDPNFPAFSEIAYAKYRARGILINLGLEVTAGNLLIPHQFVAASSVARNLSTIMAGHRPANLPALIDSAATHVESYSYSLPNGDKLIAIWDNGVAVDHDVGILSSLDIPGFAGWNATAIDVLFGFELELISSNENGDLIIQDILIKDYPIIIRLSQ